MTAATRPDPRAIYDAAPAFPPSQHGGTTLADGTVATMRVEAADLGAREFGDLRITVALTLGGVTRERAETLTQACGPLRWVTLRMALQVAKGWE